MTAKELCSMIRTPRKVLIVFKSQEWYHMMYDTVMQQNEDEKSYQGSESGYIFTQSADYYFVTDNNVRQFSADWIITQGKPIGIFSNELNQCLISHMYHDASVVI